MSDTSKKIDKPAIEQAVRQILKAIEDSRKE